MPSISERALTAARWSYAGVFGRVASQLVANIILARLLGPEAFGVFAITLLLVGPAKLVSELGMGSAMIQSDAISREDVHVVFTWLLAVGVLAAIVFFLAAERAASFFNIPAAAELIRYASVIFLFYPISIVAASQLQRSLNLKAIQIASVGSYVIGFLLVGVTCAALGLGSVSLIFAFISQACIDCLLLYVQAKPHLRLKFKKVDGRLTHFAKRVVPTNLTNWVLDSVDNFLIGKLFGAKSLGMYAVVFNLVRTPTGHIASTLQNVLFSTSSRMQHDDARLGRTYIAVLSAVSLIAVPLFAGVAAIAETCVVALYGHGWKDAGALLVPLALAMPLHCITAVTGPILWGKGRVGQELRISLVMGLVLVLALLLLSTASLVAVVWGVFAVYLIRAVWMMATIADLCAIRYRRMLDALVPGML
jgi:O-antigen/teichoic acid export membrane protein